ncbi:MAG: hypothetical protein J0I70_05085, partial [Microbacterium sp.]|nr:hypothetical protein [Microbacterium sp.]
SAAGAGAEVSCPLRAAAPLVAGAPLRSAWPATAGGVSSVVAGAGHSPHRDKPDDTMARLKEALA